MDVTSRSSTLVRTTDRTIPLFLGWKREQNEREKSERENEVGRRIKGKKAASQKATCNSHTPTSKHLSIFPLSPYPPPPPTPALSYIKIRSASNTFKPFHSRSILEFYQKVHNSLCRKKEL